MTLTLPPASEILSDGRALRLLSAMADVCEHTARRYLRGEPVKQPSKRRLEAALRAAGATASNASEPK